MPTNVYNLRNSRNSSAKSTPTKKARVNSPVKKASRLNDDVPEEVLSILDGLGIKEITQLNVDNFDVLVGKIQASNPVRKEMATAWLRYLLESNNNASWSKFMTSYNSNKKPSGGVKKAPVTRRDLISQRQKLSKKAFPTVRSISFGDLREAKGKLIAIPTGRAIKDCVSQENLLKAKNDLKKSTN